MRQFILAANKAYGALGKREDNQTNRDFLVEGAGALASGAVGFLYEKPYVDEDEPGGLTLAADGFDLPRAFNLVLGRTNLQGGPLVIPIHANNFTYVKSDKYEAATAYDATYTVPAPTRIGDYSIIIVKKGMLFNERNKWTASVHVRDLDMTAAQLAEKLAKEINGNVGSGCKAEVADAVITITSRTKGVPYRVMGADYLTGVDAVVTTEGTSGFMDANYIKDLADKACADAGFEYTYRDAYTYLYPKFPLNPLAQDDAEDGGYVVFTLRFAEPRDVKTRDEVVNQIVQVAFPTGTEAITTFESICKALAGLDVTVDEASNS